MKTNDKLVVIGRFPTNVDAEVARLRLAQSGIAACLSDDTIVANFAILTNAVVGVKLLVAETDVPQARRVLEDHDDAEPERSLEARRPWVCTKCGAEVEPGFEVCWSCGASQSGEEDRSFTVEHNEEQDSEDELESRAPTADEGNWSDRRPSRSSQDEANPYRSPAASVVPVAQSDDSLDEEEAGRADAVVMRAWRAAVFGLLLCPPILNVYSAFLLISIAGGSVALTRRGKRYYILAWVFNVLAAGWVALLIRLNAW